MNICVAGDDIEKQKKCKFFDMQYGWHCKDQRFDEYCICDEAKGEPFDDKDIGD